MADFRDIEVQKAQNNPSIISNLVGAPSNNPPAPTMTSAPQNLQDVSNIAQNLSSTLHTGGTVPAMESNRDAQMQELFNLDKQLETSSSPFPDVGGYVSNPADVSRGIAGMAGLTSSNVGKLNTGITSTEKSYLDATTAVTNKLLDYLQLQENRKQHEEEMKLKREELAYQKEKDILDRVLRGRGETSTEREKNTAIERIKQDAKNGVTIEDLLLRYKGVVDYADILNAYNETSSYGPAQRGDAVYRPIYEGVGDAVKPIKTIQDLSGKEKEDVVYSMDGLRAVEEMKQMIKEDPSIILKRLAPGESLTSSFENAAFRATESVLRARSGAAVPEAEVRRYMKGYIPTIVNQIAGNSDQKISSLQQELEGKLRVFLSPDTQIDVIEKSTGRSGKIPFGEYDSSIYRIR